MKANVINSLNLSKLTFSPYELGVRTIAAENLLELIQKAPKFVAYKEYGHHQE